MVKIYSSAGFTQWYLQHQSKVDGKGSTSSIRWHVLLHWHEQLLYMLSTNISKGTWGTKRRIIGGTLQDVGIFTGRKSWIPLYPWYDRLLILKCFVIHSEDLEMILKCEELSPRLILLSPLSIFIISDNDKVVLHIENRDFPNRL